MTSLLHSPQDGCVRSFAALSSQRTLAKRSA